MGGVELERLRVASAAEGAVPFRLEPDAQGPVVRYDQAVAAIDAARKEGLSDVEHVEAVALISGILDHAPSLPPAIRDGARAWLVENKPPPSAYMAAMRSLSSAAMCSCGHTARWHSQGGNGDCEFNAECECKKFTLMGESQ